MSEKNNTNKSRRSFLNSLRNSEQRGDLEEHEETDGNEKVKLLTPDGQLVEVKKSVLKAAKSEKANNKSILKWSNKKYH